MNILLYRIPPTFFRILLALVCVLFCIAGAVNSGWSRYYFATPFACILIWIVAHRVGPWHTLWLVPFFLACIFVSETQDDNPYLYPGRDGHLVLRSHVCVATFGSSHSPEPVRHYSMGCLPDNKLVVKAGTRLRVEGFVHAYGDMADRLAPLVRLDGELRPLFGAEQDVVPPLRARWAHRLGLLMYWPVLPFVMLQSPALFK